MELQEVHEAITVFSIGLENSRFSPFQNWNPFVLGSKITLYKPKIEILEFDLSNRLNNT